MIVGQVESSMCCLKEKQQRVGLCVEQLLFAVCNTVLWWHFLLRHCKAVIYYCTMLS